MKKLFCIFICTCILIALCMMTASAETAVDDTSTLQEEAISSISTLGIELPWDAEPAYAENIAQEQFVVALAQILSGKFGLDDWNKIPKSTFFSDVNEYGDAIDYVYAYGILNEYEENLFGAAATVAYQDALAMCVRILGYDTGDISYPYGYIICAQRLEIMNGIDIVDYDQELTAGEALHLLWNALNTIVAVTDPITEQILFPDEIGIYETTTGTFIIRETLLEKLNSSDTSPAGDLDGDGVVSVKDVLNVLDAVLDSTALDGADMNGDGKLSLIDVLRVLKAATA